MRKRLKLCSVLAALVAGLLACAGPGGPYGQGPYIGPKATLGAAGAAAAGGLIGAAAGGGPEGIVAGALLGGLLGGALGSVLDHQDRRYAYRAAHDGLEYAPSGAPTDWYNPDSGHTGSLTPTRTWQRPDGAYCREFLSDVTIDGWKERAYGTACRQPDGSWRIVGR